MNGKRTMTRMGECSMLDYEEEQPSADDIAACVRGDAWATAGEAAAMPAALVLHHIEDTGRVLEGPVRLSARAFYERLRTDAEIRARLGS